jgi:hypothetical protein
MEHEPMTDDEYAAALAHLERFTGPHAPQMTADDLALTRRTNAEGERRRRARDEREKRERGDLHTRIIAAHRGITITRGEPVDLTPGRASNPVRAYLITCNTCRVRTLALYVEYRDTTVAEAREAAEQRFGWKRLGRGGPRTYAGGNSEVWQCPTCQEVSAC